MRILIVSGIYPPEIGGPAEYAKNLREVWLSEGHRVFLGIFARFMVVPWGIRHVVFFLYLLPLVLRADYVVALDALSAGMGTVLSKLFFRKIIFRTGGDFLWEQYVERTGDLVLLKDFYATRMSRLSWKERTIFYLMRWTLQNLSGIIWSTKWQKDIFMVPYRLSNQNHFIVENYYGKKLTSEDPTSMNFIASTRKLKWKNLDLLSEVFRRETIVKRGITLDLKTSSHDEFLKKISGSYAVIIASLGDISPNTILDAIRCSKPFIITRETGLYERIKDIAIFVDPNNPDDIEEKVMWLSDPSNYKGQQEKVRSFSFAHGWEEIAKEYFRILELPQ